MDGGMMDGGMMDGGKVGRYCVMTCITMYIMMHGL